MEILGCILVVGAWIGRYCAARRYVDKTGKLPPTIFS